MREIILKLAYAGAPAAIIYIPIYFFLKKKVNQLALAGIFFILLLALAIILPNH
jgi:hypothetical protein